MVAHGITLREEGKIFLGQKKCPRNSFPLFSTIPTHYSSAGLRGRFGGFCDAQADF